MRLARKIWSVTIDGFEIQVKEFERGGFKFTHKDISMEPWCSSHHITFLEHMNTFVWDLKNIYGLSSNG